MQCQHGLLQTLRRPMVHCCSRSDAITSSRSNPPSRHQSNPISDSCSNPGVLICTKHLFRSA